MKKHSRIHQLDQIIADQIAAGEVVERPASVVKELVENSLDSNASLIEINIEKAGSRLISIKDNGCGIHQDDLALALNRHATSKLSTTEDLCAIRSLGFRGEALASIAAVSRLILKSRLQHSENAYQAIAEGAAMEVKVTPTALGSGTQVEVRDLFFNTPARRRFLRAEKTELHHIERMVYRLALSHPDIDFQFKNNGKILKHFHRAENLQQQQKRVSQILGKEFTQNCVHFSLDFEEMKLSGWLGLPNYHRSQNDGQYFFVNKRPIQDRVISHAIKQAYSSYLPLGRIAAFILFFEIDPSEIDVNVHPTKHEVRFHQSRLVHDFLARAIHQILREGQELVPPDATQDVVAPNNQPFIPTDTLKTNIKDRHRSDSYRSTTDSIYSTKSNVGEQQTLYQKLIATPPASENLKNTQSGHLPTTQIIRSTTPLTQSVQVLAPGFILFQQNEIHQLLSLEKYFLDFLQPQWIQHSDQKDIKILNILFPTTVSLTKQESQTLKIHQTMLQNLGFNFVIQQQQQQPSIKFLSTPQLLEGLPLNLVLEPMIQSLTHCFLNHSKPSSIVDRKEHIQWINCFLKKISQHPKLLLSYINFFQLNQYQPLLEWLQNFLSPTHPNWLKTLNEETLSHFFEYSQKLIEPNQNA